MKLLKENELRKEDMVKVLSSWSQSRKRDVKRWKIIDYVFKISLTLLVIILMVVSKTKRVMNTREIEVKYHPESFQTKLVDQKSLDHKYHNWHIQS